MVAQWVVIFLMVMVFDVNSISEKSTIGYIFDVDLQYPDELHVLHNDYPYAPEKCAIWNKSWNMKYSECEKEVADIKKLISSLGNKINYARYYRIFSGICIYEWNWLKFIKC